MKARIEAALEKTELEDLYLPYKPKRRTKASIAREKGLEPLAQFLWDQQPGAELGRVRRDFEGVASAEEALEGARHIVAEWVSENAEFRKAVRGMMMTDGHRGQPRDRRRRGSRGQVQDVRAVQRAGREDPVAPHAGDPARREGRRPRPSRSNWSGSSRWLGCARQVIRAPGDWAPHLEEAVEDSYDRLLNPSIQTEVRLELKDRSDEEAIKVFRENLENLLLSPPAGMLSVLAIDPGIRTGCKIAVVDDTGKFLENAVIYPFEPKNDLAGAVKTLASLVARHNVQAIAIGNGTASRETAAFVQDFLRQANLTKIFSVTVSESGASVYSASEIARQEFPDLDLTVRGAISIARRLQDPLSELVKVDPEVDRRRAVSARRGSAAAEAEPRSDRGIVREPRRRRPEYGVVGAAAVRRGDHRADRAEDRGVPQRARQIPLARAADGGAGLRAEDVRAGGGLPAHPRRRESAGHDGGASGIVPGGGEDRGVARRRRSTT